MDLAHRLAWGHRIAMPGYLLASIMLAFRFPLTQETFLLFFVTYSLQALGVSVGYHRFFSHKSFQANRITTFLFALFAGLSGQGSIHRWAYHHRLHHQFTDKTGDPHSPIVNGFWYAHVGWRFDPKSYSNEEKAKKICSEWPIEVRLLNQFIPSLFFVYPVILFLIGGWNFVEWGCFVPIVLLWNVTFTVNSISHRFGSRLFETPDQSRNIFIISFLLWGEGWHNNHHASPKNVRYGIRWYQLDMGYYLIKALQKIGFTSHLIDKNEAEIRSTLLSIPNRDPL